MASKKDMVDYYFERIEFYKKQRESKGISQTDMKLAQEDVRKYEKR